MKKLGIKNIVLYLLSAVLVVFYLVVLFWGQNPTVPPEYEMYYITHELKVWPGYNNLAYELGKAEYCTNNYNSKIEADKAVRRRGAGWHYVDKHGSHSYEDEAYLYYIPNESKSDAELRVEIKKYRGAEETYVYAGEECLGSFNGTGTYYFKIPQVVKDEVLAIKFKTEGSRFTLWRMKIS
ncbi:MAG: hypothetical protein IJB96_05865 [Lachnospira sp.]|nr:hypothetical protein [Lachnospira sp.]